MHKQLTFFPRLALVNILRNGRYYGPYLISCSGVAAMYYILRFLVWNDALQKVRGASYLSVMSSMGCFVVALFSIVLLLYANSFVMKRRQRELGLYNILGLEKRHIALLCFWEVFICAVIIIFGGILAGIIFSKLVLLFLLNLTHFPVQFGFEISQRGIIETITLFLALMALTLIWNLFKVGKSKPVDLLHSQQTGEREPKTKWLLAMIGLISLIAGYIMAITVKNPMDALLLFFLAVILVIIGTYCLFTAGSIAILKRLRANKRFYYQTSHFTAISGLLYRMKQNAVGLANICILSTMVLVTVSTTICLNIGLEEVLDGLFPYDIEVMQDLERQPGDSNAYLERVKKDAADSGTVTELSYYNRYWVLCGLKDGVMSLNLTEDSQRVWLEVVTADDYGRLTGHDIILPRDEVLAYVGGIPDFPEDFSISDKFGQPGTAFHIREHLTDYIHHNTNTLIAGGNDGELFLVVDSQETAERIMNLEPERSGHQFRIQINLDGTDEEKLSTAEYILEKSNGDYGLTSKQDNAIDFYAMYGGFLFLGIFLGILFLTATVLIIYYKQLSEGFEDQKRYQILRQVGMTDQEVTSSIHSQILLVFFLPLGTAALHILAAFPMLCKLLELFQIYNIGTFALCTVGTFLVFCAIYALIYMLTARTYDHLVKGT